MHGGGQIKTVPIHRTIHAILKTIHPLTNGNVDFHRRVAWLFTYPRATNPRTTLRLSRVLRLIRPTYIFIIFHDSVVNINRILPAFYSARRCNRPRNTLLLFFRRQLFPLFHDSDKILVLLTILFNLCVVLFNQLVPIRMQSIKKIPGDLKDLCTHRC